MTALAPTLQLFFTEHLITQRDVSPQTIASYRDTFRLPLAFAADRTGKQPCELDIDELDAPLIGAFLNHLEQARGNSIRTRNNRLAAIHSLYRYTALRHPEHLATIGRVMAIPSKRHQQKGICYLDLDEIKALLAAPDRSTWLGRRDHALLLTMILTGVRVTELANLRIRDLSLATGAHIKVTGKGRKRRTANLTPETVAVLRQWLKERHGQPDDPLFPTRQGRPLTRYGIGILLSKHIATAAHDCPSLNTKRITPHAQTHQRNAAPSRRDRHRDDRDPARPRKHQDHLHLPASRPRAQGTSHRQNRPTGHQTRQIPTHRRAPRLPRRPLIMLSTPRAQPGKPWPWRRLTT
jgi:integrase/recombinase XerD